MCKLGHGKIKYFNNKTNVHIKLCNLEQDECVEWVEGPGACDKAAHHFFLSISIFALLEDICISYKKPTCKFPSALFVITTLWMITRHPEFLLLILSSNGLCSSSPKTTLIYIMRSEDSTRLISVSLTDFIMNVNTDWTWWIECNHIPVVYHFPDTNHIVVTEKLLFYEPVKYYSLKVF